MGGSVTQDLTPISLCDALTGWTAVGGSNTLNDPAIFGQIQGSFCIQNYLASAANRGSDYDFGVNTDLTNQTIYAWFAFNKKEILQNKGSTGLRIRITDASGNWGEWDIAGKDTLPHAGWIPWAVRTSVAYSRTGGTNPTLTQIRKVGWRADAVAAKGYIYFDAWRYGQGLSVTGGSDVDPATFETFFLADDDANNKYGVVSKYEGVYYVQGVLNIGKTDQASTTYFKDSNKFVVFKDSLVGASFYAINIQGASGYTTTCYFGTKSGTSGVAGCVFNAAGAAKYSMTATNAYVAYFGLYGSSFYNAGAIVLPDYSANKETLNCAFTACSEITVGTGTVENCNFLSSTSTTTGAILLNSTSHHTKNCNFINCSRAVRFPSGSQGSYSFESLMFTGNTVDIRNEVASGQTVTITCSGTPKSNPSTHEEPNGGTTSIINGVLLKIYCKDKNQNNIANVRCAIYKQSDMTQLMNELTDVNGYAEEPFNYTGDVNIFVRLRKSSAGETRYLPINTIGTIISSGYTLSAVMYVDDVAS